METLEFTYDPLFHKVRKACQLLNLFPVFFPFISMCILQRVQSSTCFLAYPKQLALNCKLFSTSCNTNYRWQNIFNFFFLNQEKIALILQAHRKKHSPACIAMLQLQTYSSLHLPAPTKIAKKQEQSRLWHSENGALIWMLHVA